jgi:hypothetical protein
MERQRKNCFGLGAVKYEKVAKRNIWIANRGEGLF